MPTAKIVQLHDPQSADRYWYPITKGQSVYLDGGVDLPTALAELMATATYTELVNGVRKFKTQYIPALPYLLKGADSVTSSPYVQEVSVDQAGENLIVKTWSKETNGVLKEETIPIVGENTTYTLTAKYQTAPTQEVPNPPADAAMRLTDSNGVNVDALVPISALRSDSNVTVILDGNFS